MFQCNLSRGKRMDDVFQIHAFTCQVGEIRKLKASLPSENVQVEFLLPCNAAPLMWLNS